MARVLGPDYLSSPEQYAQRHCRVSGPPNEKPQSARTGAQSASGGDQKRLGSNDTTAMRSIGEILPEVLGQLQALYGRRE